MKEKKVKKKINKSISRKINVNVHPKCEGYKSWGDYGYEYGCGYESNLNCEDCKYGFGEKDPEAKCNQV